MPKYYLSKLAEKDLTEIARYGDENGKQVVIGDKNGNPIDGYKSSGGYDCAAATYDQLELEAQPISRKTVFVPD
ncbi:MAG: hypothetical protein DHS20C07_31420 [Methyloligella sp.]|nr:MAG: hypothetical protein DHS20C07_31420 [Methyloligella sp.]